MSAAAGGGGVQQCGDVWLHGALTVSTMCSDGDWGRGADVGAGWGINF